MSRTLLAAAALGLSALPAAAGCVGQCYQMRAVAPTYETVVEKVMVQAPRTYAVTTPAEYGTVYEKVMVSPGGKHWSVTIDKWGRKVGCWVTTPPRFASVPRTVMTQAPQVVPYSVPAQYGFRSHTVQTSPGFKTWEPIAGGYRPASYHPGGYGPVGYRGGYRAPGYGAGFRGGYRGAGYGGAYRAAPHGYHGGRHHGPRPYKGHGPHQLKG